MRVEDFVEVLGADYYTGVPDSQLKALCNYLVFTYGYDVKQHVIAANEGNAVALAAGYHLATGKIPVVYMQNSGEGNIINPVASLLDEHVYGIPSIFVIGWRGEPGIHDEPQHIYQGMITCKLLDDMDIRYSIIDKDTNVDELKNIMAEYRDVLSTGKSVAFVVRKGGLKYDTKVDYSNNHSMIREEVIKHIIAVSGTDPIVSTTGKASRELFEAREANGDGHGYDFLTVGSMGHASSIAMGVAVNKPDKKVWCIDGDGAALMHMGSMALLGTNKPSNMIHIIINNGAHETVGGMSTVAASIELTKIAAACGYPNTICVNDYTELDTALKEAKAKNELSFIEVKCGIGSREDLGRPTTTAKDNKIAFMNYLSKL